MTHIRPAPKIVRKEWPEVLKPTPFRTIPKDNAARSRCTDIIGLKSLDRNEPWVRMKAKADELQNKPDFSKAP